MRRAWLCGVDSCNVKSYEHRRDWVEQRLLELADVYAIGLYASAVMSKHVHVAARVDPDASAAWTDAEVAACWVRLIPATPHGEIDPEPCRTREQMLLDDANRVAICRQRLASLPWIMRSLNEPITRRANQEDACTGQFWVGRHKSQALLDDAAVLTCMSHADLNPIRAGIAGKLESSIHTSTAWRVAAIR